MSKPFLASTRFLGPKEDLCPEDLRGHILAYLPLPDLISLSRVSSGEGEIKEHLRIRVCRTLTKVGVDPEGLLSVMRKTGAVISGSTALEVVAPGTCTPNDINLYCPQGKAVEASELLLGDDAYEKIRSPERARLSERIRVETFDLNNGVAQILRFKHKSGVSLTLTESLSHSPLAPIFFFHNTVLMNCITSDEVISFYPLSTSSLTGLKNSRSARPSTHSPDKVKQWETWGFNIFTSCDADHANHVFWNPTPKHGFCHFEYRSTNDGHCARMTFSSVRGPKLPGPNLCWRLGFDVRKGNVTTRNSPVVVISTTGWPKDCAMKAVAESGNIIWHTYTAPLLSDSETIDPCLWKRCFP